MPAPRAAQRRAWHPSRSLWLLPQAHQLAPLNLHEVSDVTRNTTVTTRGCISTEQVPPHTSSFGQSPRAPQPGLSNAKPLGKNLFVSETELNMFVEVTVSHESPRSGEAVSLRSLHRITESQNSRGWKGPLWVI